MIEHKLSVRLIEVTFGKTIFGSKRISFSPLKFTALLAKWQILLWLLACKHVPSMKLWQLHSRWWMLNFFIIAITTVSWGVNSWIRWAVLGTSILKYNRYGELWVVMIDESDDDLNTSYLTTLEILRLLSPRWENVLFVDSGFDKIFFNMGRIALRVAVVFPWL